MRQANNNWFCSELRSQPVVLQKKKQVLQPLPPVQITTYVYKTTDTHSSQCSNAPTQCGATRNLHLLHYEPLFLPPRRASLVTGRATSSALPQTQDPCLGFHDELLPPFPRLVIFRVFCVTTSAFFVSYAIPSARPRLALEWCLSCPTESAAAPASRSVRLPNGCTSRCSRCRCPVHDRSPGSC